MPLWMGGQNSKFSKSVIGFAIAIVVAVPVLVSTMLFVVGALTAPKDAADLLNSLPEALRIIERWPMWLKIAVPLVAWATYSLYLFGADGLKKLWWFLSDRDKRAAQLKMFADDRALMDLREKLGARWILATCDWTPIEPLKPSPAQFLFEMQSSKREEAYRRIAAAIGQESTHIAFTGIEARAAARPEALAEGAFAFYNEGNRKIYNTSVALVEETNLFLARLKGQLEFVAGTVYWVNFPAHSIHNWVAQDAAIRAGNH